MSRSQDLYDAQTPPRYDDPPADEARCCDCGRGLDEVDLYEVFRGDDADWMCDICQSKDCDA